MAMLNYESAKRRCVTASPRVSVVIPSYNHESFVADTVRSVLAQTFRDFELLIIDDGSIDSSVQRIRKVIDEFPDNNVQLLARENVGLCKALNDGLRMSKGEFFSYVGSDDVWHPNKLEKQVKTLLSVGPEYGACFSDCLLIDESGRCRGKLSEFYDYRGGDIYEALVWNRFMPHSPTNLFRRSAIIDVGGFNESHAVEDRDLWVRLSRSYKVAYVESPLASWRSHGTNNGKNLEKMYQYGVAILDDVIAKDPRFRSIERLLRASLDGTQSYAYFAAGLRSEARRFALRSIRNNPFQILPWRTLLSTVLPEWTVRVIRSLRKYHREGHKRVNLGEK